MDRVTTSLMKAWALNHGGDSTDNEARNFELFANFVVLSRHHYEKFNVDDYSCGDDGTIGIDGFAILVNNELISNSEEMEDALSGKHPVDASVILTQVKTSSGFDLGRLSIFADTAVSLLTADVSPHPNLREQHKMLTMLFDVAPRFVANPVCRLYYITTGNWQGPAPLRSKIEDTRKRLENSNLFSRIDFNMWGAKDVQDNWRSIDTALEVAVQFDQRTTLPDMTGIREAYLGVIPASEFVKLVTDAEGDIRRTLFFDNVRDFQGENNEVNQDIESTLRSEAASRFCVLNNGVTAVARDLSVTGNRFTLRDFQIVNGCQTSHIIHRNRDYLGSVYVPFRLIVALDDDVANSITRATNRQSSVTAENLFSLAEVQRRIESYFNSFDDNDEHRIYYERRSKQWSGSAQVRGTWRVITLRNLMQSFAAMYLRIPHTAARYYGDLRARVGTDVFAESHHAAYYYSAAYGFCKLDHYFSRGTIDRELKPVRYHLLAGVRTLAAKSASLDKIESNESRAELICRPFNDFLWNDRVFAEALTKCELVLRELAGSQEINRDFGRTRDFTEQYLRALL